MSEYKSPFMAVDCPTCGAKVGHWCKRPSGHSGPMVAFHAARRKAAQEAEKAAEPDEAVVTGWPRASVGGMKIGRFDILTLRSRAIDVLTLATGQVLAVMRDGIELWPNLEEMLSADPAGDFARMEAFFEYSSDCYVIDDPWTRREPEEWDSPRFGLLRRTSSMSGIYVRDVYAHGHYTVVELNCGPALRIDDDDVSYWGSVAELLTNASAEAVNR